MSTQLKLTAKVLTGIYGSTRMARALAKHIDENMEKWRVESDEYTSLEHIVHLQIWNWFAGGDTALHAAQEVLKIYEGPH